MPDLLILLDGEWILVIFGSAVAAVLLFFVPSSDYEFSGGDDTATGTSGLSLKGLKDRIPADCFRPSFRRALLTIVVYCLLPTVVLHGALLGTDFAPVKVLVCYLMAWSWLNFLNVVHGCAHQNFFPSRTVNRVVGPLFSAWILYPWAGFRKHHFAHHGNATHIDREVDLGPVQTTEISDAFLRRMRTPLGLVVLPPIILPAVLWFKRCTLTDGLLVLGRIALVGLLLGPTWGSYFWHLVLPSLFFSQLSVLMNLLNHTHPRIRPLSDEDFTSLDSALNSVTVTRAPFILSKGILPGIVDCHALHHLFPNIPEYHMRRANQCFFQAFGTRFITLEFTSIIDFHARMVSLVTSTYAWDRSRQVYINYREFRNPS